MRGGCFGWCSRPVEVRENRAKPTPNSAMVLEPVLCPACHGSDVVKHGRSSEGKQRYKCRNADCSRSTFIRDYSYRGYLPEVKQQIADMAVNGSGIRDTARVLSISPTTVIEELKKVSPPEASEPTPTGTIA